MRQHSPLSTNNTMRRRRTFGGKSGVWWRKHNRLSIGSTPLTASPSSSLRESTWEHGSEQEEPRWLESHDGNFDGANADKETDNFGAVRSNTLQDESKPASPQWVQPKRQGTFGGKLCRMVKPIKQSRTARDAKPTLALEDKTNVNSTSENFVAKQEAKKRQRKCKRSVADAMTPLTEKEVNYYRTRFQQVDKAVKLNVECVDQQAKRPRRQPKKLNLI